MMIFDFRSGCWPSAYGVLSPCLESSAALWEFTCESSVISDSATPRTVDCQALSVHGIFQARILE